MSEITKPAMSEQDAHRLTERIRIAAVNYTEAKEKLLRLVTEAKEGAAHEALGYKSWTAYLADVMSEEPMRLARDERQEVVQLLTEEGMPVKYIAPVVSASIATVERDRAATASPSNEGHAERVIQRSNGTSYTYTPKTAQSAPSPAEVIDEATGEILSDAPEPERTPEDEKTERDLALINDIRLYLGHMGRSRQIKNMSPKAKQHIINALQDTITTIQGETS